MAFKELCAALSKAQAEIQNAKKDSQNPHFKSKYADLASTWNACRAALTKHGLSVAQTVYVQDGHMFLKTILMHESCEDRSQCIESDCPIITTKNDSQGFGSAVTYARRFSLAAMVGVAPDDDDDGNASVSTTTVPDHKQNIAKEFKLPQPAVKESVPAVPAKMPPLESAKPGSTAHVAAEKLSKQQKEKLSSDPFEPLPEF